MSLIKKIFQIILTFVILPLAVAGSLYSLEQHGFFNIENIDIVIENLTDQPQYLQPLVKNVDQLVEASRGTSLWRLDLHQLSFELNSFSWVENVSVVRKWPDRLQVTIKAKEVKLLLVNGAGQFVPVVGQGELLSPLEVKQIPDVALLAGAVFLKQPEMRSRAIALLDELPRKGPFSHKTISEVHFDEKDGFWVTLVKDGIKVKLGNEQVMLKSARLNQVIEYLESRQIDVRVIDANLSKKVLVRLRKGP
jgi:cell division protein FtsQ